MILSAIAAMAKNRVIGVKNALPWSIPEDLRFFKEKTKGRILIMGRKTFESLPGALPNRFHIIVTRNPDFYPKKTARFNENEFAVTNSVEQAIELAGNMLRPEHPLYRDSFGDEVFVCGGSEIYEQSLPFLDRIYLTVIEKDFPGDAHFPDFSHLQMKLTRNEKRESEIPFTFQTWEKP